ASAHARDVRVTVSGAGPTRSLRTDLHDLRDMDTALAAVQLAVLFGGGAEARVVLSAREKDRPRLRPTGRRPDRGAPAHPVPLSRPRALGGDLRWSGRAGLLGAWDLARAQAHTCSRRAGDRRGSGGSAGIGAGWEAL